MAERPQFIPVRFAVLTVSDTRTSANDKSGDTLAGRLTDAGHILSRRDLVPDDIGAIRDVIEPWIEDPEVEAILTTGGTGLTARDVTVEAIEPLFDKRIDGFSAVFHRISYDKIGTSTIQSRAAAGIARGTFIFLLPGSPGACRDAWDGILSFQFDHRQAPCNLVEIMPRVTTAF